MDHHEISDIYLSRHVARNGRLLERSNDPRLRYIGQYIPQDKKSVILDAGCGDGKLAMYWHQRGYEKIQGIDLFDELNTWNTFNYRKASISQTGLADNSVDFIYCLGVILYLDDPAEGFAELYRILKPGGKVVFSAHTVHSPFTWERRLNRKFGGEIHLRDVKFKSADTYVTQSRRVGFRVLDMDGYELLWLPRLLRRVYRKLRQSIFGSGKRDGSAPEPWRKRPSWLKWLYATSAYHMLIALEKPEKT
ncbi:SAM-dependent methyltransferase [Oleiphilus messinensis]|uniref:SAM-dependent methyltransferase n=1 Tax=Oleiphilus messinensis TaxID=141451 RepID=A0A1Y0IG93_9GAMM|nr:class I SAM-dependent methyltransferase [Oleiphilus messinensis]ARU59517.1 SAM-dependent methyltransferase [Oleiphilus messinensis]